MTDGPVRVMPRVPLVATQHTVDGDWCIALPPDPEFCDGTYTRAEFAAHFVPADAYERLIAALKAWADAVADLGPYPNECDELCAAYRAYIGGD